MKKALQHLYNILARFTLTQRLLLLSIATALPVTMYFGWGSTQDLFEWASPRFSKWPFGMIDYAVNVGLLSAALAALHAILRRLRRSRSGSTTNAVTEKAPHHLLDDVALGDNGTDELEREKFLSTIERVVVLPPKAHSLVLAIESPWGSGKSSFLDLLTARLKDHASKPLVIRFSPWLATGQNRISRAFFSQFSAALLHERERSLAEKMLEYGEKLEALLPAGARSFPRLGLQPVSRLLGKIPVIDLEGERQQLSARVSEVGRPIVVIVDDIDRLPPRDVRVVFQLIKAVAAFPRVTYLLAFDPVPIDRALSFGGTRKEGRSFRDKIVQANFSLPRVRYATRKKFFVSRLEELIDSWNLSLEPFEVSLKDRAIPLVLAALATPRSMKRVLNKTMLTADNVRGEVNFADVLVFETLHLQFPQVAEVLRHNPKIVNPSGLPDSDVVEPSIAAMVREELEERKKDGKLDDLLRLYPSDRETLADLLRFLFPNIFGDSQYAEDLDSDGECRVSSHANFLKLLYQGLHGEFASSSEARTFLTNEAERPPMLADALKSGSLAGWLSHISRHIGSVEVTAPEMLIREIALAVNRAYVRSRENAADEARWLILRILDGISDPSDQWQALDRLVRDQQTAAVGEKVLTSLLHDSGLWENGQYLGQERKHASTPNEFKWATSARLDELRNVWLSAMRALGVRDLIVNFPNAGSALFRWAQLSDPPDDEVKRELEQALEDPSLASAFVRLFPPGSGLTGIERLLTDKSRALVRKAAGSIDIPKVIWEKFDEYFSDLDDDAKT